MIKKSVKQALQVQKPMFSFQKYRWPFLISLLVAAIVHFSMCANGLLNADSLWTGPYNIASDWELKLGRWGIQAVDLAQGGAKFTVLSAAVTLLAFTCAGILIVGLYQVNGKCMQTLICLSLVCSPMIGYYITYRYCAVAYSLSFVLAVLAVYVCIRATPDIVGILTGAICLIFALSIYQANIGATFMVMISYLILYVLRNPQDLKKAGRILLKLVLTGLLGLGLYYSVSKVILLVRNISMSNYKGADQIGVGVLIRAFPSSIGHAYHDFLTFFFTSQMARNSFGAIVLYSLLFVVMGMAFLGLLIKNRKYLAACAFALILLCLVPVASCAIDLFAPFSTMNLFLCEGLLFVVPLALAVIASITDTVAPAKWKYSRPLLQGVSAFLACCLIWSFALQNNTDAGLIKSTTSSTVALAERILVQLESSDAYSKKMPVCIAGVPSRGNYPMVYPLLNQADPYAQMGLIINTYDGSTNDWWQLYNQYLGVGLLLVPADRFREIAKTDAYAQMPIYPEKGSMVEIDGVLVVKVSKTDDFT